MRSNNLITADGYGRHLITIKPGARIKVRPISAYKRERVIASVSCMQLKRNDLTVTMRNYLIGKRSIAEQTCGKFRLGSSRNETRVCRGNIATSTRRRLGIVYNCCYNAVRDYEFCAKAIDILFAFDKRYAMEVLHEDVHISLRTLIFVSKLSPDQTETEIKRLLRYRSVDQETPMIKSMPKYDPDAETAGLSLTIPSWIDFIERTKGAVTAQISDKAAEALFDKLNELISAAKKMLEYIMEVL